MWRPTIKKFNNTLEQLCRMTTPHGCEAMIWPMLPNVPRGAAPGCSSAYKRGHTMIDEHGNYIVHIPGSRVMWTSHCDTADSHPTHVSLKRTGNFLHTDGKSILGADDKVGVCIMIMMIKAGVPGTYVFFAGEEVGCVGSSNMSDDIQYGDYDCCISLDRYGYTDIITHQCGTRTASDEWAAELAERINKHSGGIIDMSPSSRGVFTDSREFKDIIPECTNISVGYFNQHTHQEKADTMFAYLLCCALIDMCTNGEGVPEPKRTFVDDFSEERDWLNKCKFNRPFDYDNLSDNDWRLL